MAFRPRLKKVHRQNVLALCRLCAAKYKHVRNTQNPVLEAELLEISVGEDDGEVALPISLNGERVTLRFTGKHAIDLQAVIGAAGEERGD